MLDRLAADYDVGRAEGGTELDPDLPGNLSSIVTLRPADNDAAPLIVGFTNFPGLAVRLGAWHVLFLPHCGCDYCNEDPAGLVQELGGRVSDLVAGRFSESVADGWLIHRFSTSSGRSRIRGDETPSLPTSGRHDWGPWPLRRPT